MQYLYKSLLSHPVMHLILASALTWYSVHSEPIVTHKRHWARFPLVQNDNLISLMSDKRSQYCLQFYHHWFHGYDLYKCNIVTHDNCRITGLLLSFSVRKDANWSVVRETDRFQMKTPKQCEAPRLITTFHINNSAAAFISHHFWIPKQTFSIHKCL